MIRFELSADDERFLHIAVPKTATIEFVLIDGLNQTNAFRERAEGKYRVYDSPKLARVRRAVDTQVRLTHV